MDKKPAKFAPTKKEKQARLVSSEGESGQSDSEPWQDSEARILGVGEDGAGEGGAGEGGAGEGGAGESGADATGQRIDGTFLLEKCLGQGGMGVVYQARHQIVGNRVALKLLNQGTASTPELVERFRREAVAVSRLDHPNIVRLKSFDVSSDDQAYLVMDLVEGRALSEIIKERRTIPAREALEITRQVLAALEHAHKHHIIHRDIKPGNIMIVDGESGRPVVKVVDFGLAKVLGVVDGLSHNLTLTKTGEMLGSPLYMSPEQCTGDDLDARSDIYSTGCVLYEMLSGQPPFNAENFLKVLHLHATKKHKSLSDLDLPGNLDSQINDLLNKAMAKNPAKRYDDAAEMEAAVASILAGWDEAHAVLSDSVGPAPGAEGKSDESSSADHDSLGSFSDFKSGMYIDPKERAKRKSAQQATDEVAQNNRENITVSVICIFVVFLCMLGMMAAGMRTNKSEPVPQEHQVGEHITETKTVFEPTNLTITDPSSDTILELKEPQNALGTETDIFKDPSQPAKYTMFDSTIDGGLPDLYYSDEQISRLFKKLDDLSGRPYSALNTKPIKDIAEELYKLGDIGRALSYYQSLVKYADLNGLDRKECHMRIGDCYMYFNRFGAAAKEYKEALSKLSSATEQSEFVEIAQLQLKLFYIHKTHDDAHPDFTFDAMEAVKRLDKNTLATAAAKELTGDIFLLDGEPANAITWYESLNSSGFYPQIRLRLAKAYLANHEPEKAEKLLNETLQDIEKQRPTDQQEADLKKLGVAYRPRIYYILGMANEQKYELDRKWKDRALDYFNQALMEAVKNNPAEKHSAFAVMCLGKLSRLEPNYKIKYDDGERSAAAEYQRLRNYGPIRSILPPSLYP